VESTNEANGSGILLPVCDRIAHSLTKRSQTFQKTAWPWHRKSSEIFRQSMLLPSRVHRVQISAIVFSLLCGHTNSSYMHACIHDNYDNLVKSET